MGNLKNYKVFGRRESMGLLIFLVITATPGAYRNDLFFCVYIGIGTHGAEPDEL